MANAVTTAAKETFLNVLTGTIKVALLENAYTFNAAHDNFDDLVGVVATGTLTGVSITAGLFDADDTVFVEQSGTEVTQLFVYLDTGDPATSTLLFYFDDFTSAIPNGNDFTVIWHATGIYQI